MIDDKNVSTSISIIIPAFNAERFIGETIQSALSQTCQDFEIIVIDDGSKDNTRGVIADIEDERIDYIFQENHGSAAARNIGIRKSRGGYIAFLDADDIWHPEMLERCIEIFKASPEISVVHTNWGFINEAGQILPGKGSWQPWRGDVSERLILRNPFITPAMVVRRECFDDGVLQDETDSSGDDWGMWLRIAMRGFLFDCIDLPLVFYRRHDTNITLDYENMVCRQEAFLKSFFSQPNLPARILEKRNPALARVYFNASVVAFNWSDTDRGIASFEKAILMDTSLLLQLSSYFEIICSSQPIGFQGSELHISLEKGEKHLFSALEQVFNRSLVITEIIDMKSEIYALALFALGSVAYTYLQDLSSARRYYLRSVITYPPIIRKARVVSFLLRTLMGKRLISVLRYIRRHLDGSPPMTSNPFHRSYDSPR